MRDPSLRGGHEQLTLKELRLMNNEINNGANIDQILAQNEQVNSVTMWQRAKRVGLIALAPIAGVIGLAQGLDSEPAAPRVEAAPVDCDPVMDVCDGQTIVYEDPFDSTVGTNVSGVTFPDKGEETTTTTTEPKEETTTTTTEPKEETTTTTTEPEEETTTTSTTTVVPTTVVPTTVVSTTVPGTQPPAVVAPPTK